MHFKNDFSLQALRHQWIYRACYRGTQEADVIIGQYFAPRLRNAKTVDEIMQLAQCVNMEDDDLLQIAYGIKDTSIEENAILSAFHTHYAFKRRILQYHSNDTQLHCS